MIDSRLEKTRARRITLPPGLKISPAISYSSLDSDRSRIRSRSKLLINSHAIEDICGQINASCERHPFHYSLARSFAGSRCTCTRPTDIFRDLHHRETRNAVHLEGGLTVEVRRPMKMQIVYPPPLTTRALGHYFMVIGWVLKCGAYLRGGFSVSLATAVTPGPSLYPSYNRPALTWNIKKHDDIRHGRAIVTMERLLREKYRGDRLYGEATALPNRL